MDLEITIKQRDKTLSNIANHLPEIKNHSDLIINAHGGFLKYTLVPSGTLNLTIENCVGAEITVATQGFVGNYEPVKSITSDIAYPKTKYSKADILAVFDSAATFSERLDYIFQETLAKANDSAKALDKPKTTNNFKTIKKVVFGPKKSRWL